jgi:hypothetical protein
MSDGVVMLLLFFVGLAICLMISRIRGA